MMGILERSVFNLLGRGFVQNAMGKRLFAADSKTAAKPTDAANQTKNVTSKNPGEMTAVDKKAIPRDSYGMPTILMGIMKPDDPLVQQGYGIGRTAIRLDWWNNNSRWHYWAAWWMLKDVNRRKLVVQHAPYRARMTALMDNNILPVAFRESVEEELNKLPRNCKWELTKSMCQITGRRRGKVVRYRLSRIKFRDLADHGKVCGVQRSCF